MSKKVTLLDWLIKNDTGKRGPNGETGLNIGQAMSELNMRIEGEGAMSEANTFRENWENNN
jgi:hypothetical protein